MSKRERESEEMARWTCKCQSGVTEPVDVMRRNDNDDVDETLTFSTSHDVVDVLVDRERRHLRRRHRVDKKFLENQDDFSHRELDQVLEWLGDVCWERCCNPEIFSLAAQGPIL